MSIRISAAQAIRGVGESILKNAMPHGSKKDHSGFDFYFEVMDKKDKKKLFEDFLSGETITLADFGDSIGPINKPITNSIKTINIGEMSDKGKDTILYLMDSFLKSSGPLVLLKYNSKEHKYELADGVRVNNSKTAKLGETYSYASTQVDLPSYLADEVMSWGKENIPKEDLEGIGLEDEIHATIFYGIKSDDPGQVRKILRHFRPFEIRLGLITHFDTPDNDVLKISVESPVLESMHYLFEHELENDNTFPTFQPHVTIAYLKKGMAKKYIGNDYFRGLTFSVDNIIFSSKANKKVTLKISS